MDAGGSMKVTATIWRQARAALVRASFSIPGEVARAIDLSDDDEAMPRRESPDP
jgi:hypothetical protein